MKRRELERHLNANGCEVLREGAAHTTWINRQTGARESVPRHTEVKKHLAKKICRELSVPLLPGA